MKLLSTLFFVFMLTTLQAQETVQVVKKSFNDGLPEITHFYLNSEAEENLIQIKHYNRKSQITYSADYQKGVQHGKTMYFNDYDLTVSKDLNYVSGELEGIQVGYFRENEKRFEYFYKDGKLDGTQREWHSNGKQKSEWNLENGVLNGVQKSWKSYNDESEETIFDNGFFTESSFDDNEKLVDKRVYKAEIIIDDFSIAFDKKLSELHLYYKNGKLKEHTTFDEIKTIVYYYENGNNKSTKQFKDNSKIGKWTFWYENSNLKEEGEYTDNIKTGKWTFWYENSNLKEEGEYADNIKNGDWKFWYEDGNLKEQGEYTQNKKNGQWEFWFDNGSKSTEGGFLDDKKTGNWTYWTINGQQEKFGAYKKGREQGIWQYWNDKEQIAEERNFDYGNQKKWKVFFYGENGQLIASGFLDKKGNKTQLWEYWFENGDKKRVEVYKPGSYHNGRPIIKYFEESYPDGQLKQKGDDKKFVEYTYANKKIVTEKHFIQNKDNRRYEYYEDGEIKKQWSFQKNEGGDMITREVVENMLAQEIHYYENGNKKSFTKYCTSCKSVAPEALKELNNTIGKICRTCPAYTKAYRNLEEPVYNLKGVYKEWYENEQLRLELTYDNNCLKSMQQEWYPSGEMMLQVVLDNKHPYTKEIIDSEDCVMFITHGTYFDEKGKQFIFQPKYTTRSIQKAGKEKDTSLLEPVKKSKKILEIEAQSYLFAEFLK